MYDVKGRLRQAGRLPAPDPLGDRPIFTRDITRWSGPGDQRHERRQGAARPADHAVGRNGQSGTTALFYDSSRSGARGVPGFRDTQRGTGIGPLPPDVRPIHCHPRPDADWYRLFADSEQIATSVAQDNVPFSRSAMTSCFTHTSARRRTA